ncbi:Crp/Fnr family transcriptional regulator [Streptomyces lushanensis]|uniref:Crp/Fnr family transcriptional regulator n=1 Tax=Streptomyces lushanensis TaxID=1434255 RepID=UPI0008332BD4|nr:cyclic nucleotide-binding domain-containing protein [Streptomyces lushanensis]
MTTTTDTTLHALSPVHRERLMHGARQVNFPEGTRIFDEGQPADRFWIVRSGCVILDVRVPGRRPAEIASLGAGSLVGWSWLFPPFVWQLGAEAMTLVRTYEFDADDVRLMCHGDPVFGQAVALWIGGVLAHRLHEARTRLLDLFAPYGSSEGPMP